MSSSNRRIADAQEACDILHPQPAQLIRPTTQQTRSASASSKRRSSLRSASRVLVMTRSSHSLAPGRSTATAIDSLCTSSPM